MGSPPHGVGEDVGAAPVAVLKKGKREVCQDARVIVRHKVALGRCCRHQASLHMQDHASLSHPPNNEPLAFSTYTTMCKYESGASRLVKASWHGGVNIPCLTQAGTRNLGRVEDARPHRNTVEWPCVAGGSRLDALG